MTAVRAETTGRLKPLSPMGGGGFKRGTRRTYRAGDSADCLFGKDHVTRIRNESALQLFLALLVNFVSKVIIPCDAGKLLIHL